MGLRDTFLAVTPRERSGPLSSDRFAYQRDWALCQLLKLHSETSGDYLIVFDLHDDVLVFDSEAHPTLISFFQVKTRTPKHWTRSDLVRTRSGQNGRLPSCLGKLYSNKQSFPANTDALVFVSNAAIDLPHSDGSQTASRQQFTFAELAQTERDAIVAKLASECGDCTADALETHLRFEVSDLSLSDHATHTKGRLGEFLEQLQPTRKFKVSLVYKTLSDEVTRRNNCNDDHASFQSFDDLPRKKGISRTGFEGLLQTMGIYADPDDMWNRAEQRLNTESMPILRVKALRRRWSYVEAQRFDPENLQLAELTTRVVDVMQMLTGDDAPQTLTELLEIVVSRVKQDRNAFPSGSTFDDDDVRVLTLMRSYEDEQELQASSARSSEENA